MNRLESLKKKLADVNPASKEALVEINNIPEPTALNLQGFKAYAIEDKLKLVMMLNTLKVLPQFYRDETVQLKTLKDTIENLVSENQEYFVCQAIVWSRCLGEGLRTVTCAAAAIISRYITGQEYAKRFFGMFDKSNNQGGCIFRIDDMQAIAEMYKTIYGEKTISNAMKKGFASVLENASAYTLVKYRTSILDLVNVCHPDTSKSNAWVDVTEDMAKQIAKVNAYRTSKDKNPITVVDGKVKVFDALMNNITLLTETWEDVNSQAGQLVAAAIKEGKITSAEGAILLKETKSDNWRNLLKNSKLGIIAALRNIRNILSDTDNNAEILKYWCNLITDKNKIKSNLVLPIYFDLAYDAVINSDIKSSKTLDILTTAIQKGYNESIPNLAEAMKGNTLLVIDCSGSMSASVTDGKQLTSSMVNNTSRCSYKAGLIAATFAKALEGTEVIKFGSEAEYYNYKTNTSVFDLAKDLGTREYGGTDLSSVFKLLIRERKQYDRIIILSDNELNINEQTPTGVRYRFLRRRNNNLTAIESYKQYIKEVCSPYIYIVDLASYGTVPLFNENKVQLYYGYGPSMYEELSRSEFNPESHFSKILSIKI